MWKVGKNHNVYRFGRIKLKFSQNFCSWTLEGAFLRNFGLENLWSNQFYSKYILTSMSTNKFAWKPQNSGHSFRLSSVNFWITNIVWYFWLPSIWPPTRRSRLIIPGINRMRCVNVTQDQAKFACARIWLIQLWSFQVHIYKLD